MTRHTIDPRRLLAALGVSLAMLHAAPAAAQSSDDLFDPNTLQELRLTINTRDLRDLRAKSENNTYYTADLQWRNIRVRNAGVRSRGNASRNGIKLGLRVDLDRYVTGQKFLGLKSFILKNLWQDGSMMHERLAMSFFARMGQAASRESFCRLYINNEFQGLYVIVESVDNTYLTRTIGENKGYLYSYQIQDTFWGEYLGDDLEPYKIRFEAQSHEKEGDSKLYVPIHDWLREVNEPDDAVWRERVEQYVDLRQFVTQVAIEMFLAENDGLLGAYGMNNFFLYRFADTNRHRFFPWDKDNAFLVTDYSIFQRTDENVLFRRAFAYQDLRELYFEVLESAARSAAEDTELLDPSGKVTVIGWLEAQVGRLAEQVAATVEQDSRKPFSTEAFYESVEILKQFAQQRSKFVLDQVADARKRR
jgi:spore coat protein CotH